MYCSTCGNEVKEGQAVCLNCGFYVKGNNLPYVAGMTTSNGKSRVKAAIWCFFLGAFGAHYFYLENKRVGWWRLLIGLSGFVLIIPLMITSVLAFIEFIQLVLMDDPEHLENYQGVSRIL